MNITQSVIEKLETLPLDQQQKVLDFVEGLLTEAEHEQESPSDNAEISFLEAAGEFIGCVEGPGDLSTNPKYMEGYGQS
ncbi:hypothetical protein [Leptodesmis sichuanensis]|uniref:hypothetical protein n=1 Tax=Leptodesmis sichuanensis TaxID=2906798 RepID=UPI001F1BC9E8|nr:hypothetical protein [Leptodesmis sichuanensis]UIE36209.1 hypothetical protein KIK02_14130 [Leptodesmis sichuanensis A121]